MSSRAKRILKKTGKILLYTILVVVVLIIGFWFYINSDSGKRVVKNKAVDYLQKKFKTKVEIDSIDYSLPKWVIIKGLYIEDVHHDTLLYAKRLAVDLDMLKLLGGETYIRKIEMSDAYARINRNENDTAFNFQFIIDAFAGNKPADKVDVDTASVKLTLKKLSLNNVRLDYTDQKAGSRMYAKIKDLAADVDNFQTEKLRFDVSNLTSTGLDFSMLTYKKSNVVVNPADTLKFSLRILAGLLNLSNVNVMVADSTTGMFYSNMVQHLVLDKADVDLGTGNISGNKLLLDSSFIKFVSPKQVSGADTAAVAAAPYNISLNEAKMTNNRFQFDDNNLPSREGLDPGHMDLQGIKLNTGKLVYTTDSMTGVISQLAFKDKSGFTIDTTHVNLVYTNRGITASELYIKTPHSVIQNTIQVRYDDVSQLMNAPQNSYVDIKLQNSIIAINDLYTLMPALKATMDPAKFANNYVALTTNMTGSLSELHIPLLQLHGFNGTVINATAILYNVTDMKRLGYDITIFNSVIPRSDLLKFLPENNKALADKAPSLLNFSSRIKGNLKNTVASFNINSDAFRFVGQVNLQNLDDPKKLQYNTSVTEGRVSRDFLVSLLPPGTLPADISLPPDLTISGTAKGDMNNLQPDLKISSSYGKLAVKGTIKNMKDKDNATYDLAFSSNDLQLGRLLTDSTIGSVTMKGTAKGRGFDYKKMNAVIAADIQSFGFRKYNYQDISFNATLNNGRIIARGTSNDKNLRMVFNASLDVSGQYPRDVIAKLLVDTINFQALHLYKDPLMASFSMSLRSADLDPNRLDLYAVIDSSKLMVKGKRYALDSIVAKAVTTNGINDVSVRAPFLDLTARGDFDYDKIGQSILQYVDKYYNVVDRMESIPPQQVTFEGTLKKHPLLPDLVPGLAYEDLHFKGSYSSTRGDSALNLQADIPFIALQGYDIHKGTVNITSVNDRLNGVVNFDTLRDGKNVFYGTNITADLANDSLSVSASTKDKNNTARYAAGATIVQREGGYVFSLKPDLLLNYQKWNVSGGNQITYAPGAVLVKDFTISNGNEKISMASQSQVLNSPVAVNISNFNISTITSFINSDTLLASGLINGNFTVSDFDKQLPAVTGSLVASQLQFKQQTIGTVKLETTIQSGNSVYGNLTLSENGNDVNITGTYYLNNADKDFDATMTIRQLQLSTLQAFSNGTLQNSSGRITGDVALTGKFTDPRWNGSLGFDSAKFTVSQLGTPYLIDKQKIALAYPDLTLNNFTIKDVEGHPMSVNGKMTEKTLLEYDLDLDLKANNFTIINAPRAINNQVYGYAAVNTDIRITGTSTRPDIQGEISLNDKTDLTVILPERTINKDAVKTVVRFIDRDTFELPEKVKFEPANEVQANFGQFLNYNLNFSVTKNAILNIIIDPSTGDALRVQGDANLNAGVDPGGNLLLVGNYELSKGSYILNYQFLRREFNLLPGSTITFGGVPMDALVNVSAEYIANTSPRELIGNEITDIDPKVSNTFNQKIPFRVLLYLKGQLKRPEISFDIQLPTENSAINSQVRTSIENKLAQIRGDVASTNKQVFSLLLLNRFIGEQSSDFFKGNGTNFNDIARESVSKFLSSALDQIADDLFKGLDIDFNLNSYRDYSSGGDQQRTDLTVNISKTFLNERLTITVGRNFGIEGDDAVTKATQQKANGVIPDVTLNYKLTADGRYAIKVYKKTAYEVILDGYIMETGMAFIITMDYDKFHELFRRRKKK